MGKKAVPDRWKDYSPVGQIVPGTRFLPFKVPLKNSTCSQMPRQEWFTPDILISEHPQVKAIIDLTNTIRYYNPAEFEERGIKYRKVALLGRILPPQSTLTKFFDIVDEFSATLEADALIGVHCTHGLNRTGYLICKYMVTRMKVDPAKAITLFESARNHKIERPVYIKDILMSLHTRPSTGRRTELFGKSFEPIRPLSKPIERGTTSIRTEPKRCAQSTSSTVKNWRMRPDWMQPSVSEKGLGGGTGEKRDERGKKGFFLREGVKQGENKKVTRIEREKFEDGQWEEKGKNENGGGEGEAMEYRRLRSLVSEDLMVEVIKKEKNKDDAMGKERKKSVKDEWEKKQKGEKKKEQRGKVIEGSNTVGNLGMRASVLEKRAREELEKVKNKEESIIKEREKGGREGGTKEGGNGLGSVEGNGEKRDGGGEEEKKKEDKGEKKKKTKKKSLKKKGENGIIREEMQTKIESPKKSSNG